MVDIIKPYTFQAGTKARANEVNDDFDVLYRQVNANTRNISSNAADIELLQTGKASITGSSANKFDVDDATNDYNATNLRTLRKYLKNSVGLIWGLTIARDSDNVIRVMDGACYDNSKTYIMVFETEDAAGATYENTNQAANALYYVYIVGDRSGDNTDIVISTSAIHPEGYGDDDPSNRTYRKIGYFRTDSDRKISTVYSLGFKQNVPNGISNVVKTYHSSWNGYIVYSDGFIMQWGRTSLTNVDYGDTVKVELLIPFGTSRYNVSGSDDHQQSAGDKGSTWSVGEGITGKSRTTTYFYIYNGFENHNGDYVYWLATGY